MGSNAKKKPATPASDLDDLPASEQGQEHEFTCSIAVGRTWVKVENEQVGRVRRDVLCHEGAKFIPLVVFRGREMRIKHDDMGKVIRFRGSRMYEMPVRFQPVCARHRKEIEANPRVLLTPTLMRSQEKSLVDAGFPPPEPKFTKLKWLEFEPPEDATESEHLEHLVADAEGRTIQDDDDGEGQPA